MLSKELTLRHNYLNNSVVETIYFGGGTPSLLTEGHFERIFNTVYSVFSISDRPEITLEANPDDMSEEYVRMLANFPFNRVSLGVQSFNDADLRFLKRRHNAKQAIEAIERCRNANLLNISIDLMYGLPLTELPGGNWNNNLETAIALRLPHISAYSLTYEQGTPLSLMNDIQPLDDEQCEALYLMTNCLLAQAGYRHYEISNYAMPTPQRPEGACSKHNMSYWQGVHYLGVGAAAHSYNGLTRSWNVPDLKQYINAIMQNTCFCETEQLDVRTRYNDFLITRLRTDEGFSLSQLQLEFGDERYRRFLHKSKLFQDLNIVKFEGDNVKLFEEKMFVSDAVLRELIEL